MPIFKCPDCGKEISDRAKACPHCGRPVGLLDQIRVTGDSKPKSLSAKTIVTAIVGVVVALLIFYASEGGLSRYFREKPTPSVTMVKPEPKPTPEEPPFKFPEGIKSAIEAIEVERDTFGPITLKGKAILPAGTKIRLTLTKYGKSEILGQDKTVIDRDGNFTAGAFSNQGEPHPPGNYSIEIVAYFNGSWKQSKCVMAAAGNNGLLLPDKLSKISDLTGNHERYIEENITLKFPRYSKELVEIVAAERKERLREEAEERKFNRSRAGRICKRHPTWTRAECTGIAKHRYWIGMHIDMLVESRGRPNSHNPSNYGNGVRHQYCWSNWTPACFYDNNNDGKIDSYN